MDRSPIILLILMLTLFSNCYKRDYSRFKHNAYQTQSLKGKKFIVMPFSKVNYNYPSGCIPSPKDYETVFSEAVHSWQGKITLNLRKKFPGTQFIPASFDSLTKTSQKAISVYALAKEQLQDFQFVYQTIHHSQDTIRHKALKKNIDLVANLNSLPITRDADFVIIFVNTNITYEQYYNTSDISQFINKSTVNYQTMAQFGIWNIHNGDLVYASGIYGEYLDSGCIFSNPRPGRSIDNSIRSLSKKLEDVVALILLTQKNELESVQLLPNR